MSLSRSVPPSALTPDEAMRRWVGARRRDLEPDPLFRRRLRGEAVNRFVAAREGLIQPERRPSQMGRLGRACLYATFALAATVGGAMAASRGAVPGELLYPVKLQIEALRMQTFPEEFRDELMVQALTERIAEFGRLVEAGEWQRASSLLATIDQGHADLAALDIEAAPGDAISARVTVLRALTERLPAQAQAAIERALEPEPAVRSTPAGGHSIQPADSVDPSGGPAAAPPRGPGVDNGRNPATSAPSPSPEPRSTTPPPSASATPAEAGTEGETEAEVEDPPSTESSGAEQTTEDS